MDRLRPEEREAIVGRIELGLSYDELALALDKPTADAARKAAQRALVRLAGEMQRERRRGRPRRVGRRRPRRRGGRLGRGRCQRHAHRPAARGPAAPDCRHRAGAPSSASRTDLPVAGRARDLGTFAAARTDRHGGRSERSTERGTRGSTARSPSSCCRPSGRRRAPRDVVNHRGRPAAGAGAASQRRHDPRRGADRRSRRPVDGVRRRPHAPRSVAQRRTAVFADRGRGDRPILCAAVAAVHGAGLLHRDITARNVMLAGDGRVVLMDFGSGADSATTVAGALAGTPLYLAPELLAGAGRPSVQSDLYSIGVLFYFLLTGGYPVRGVDLDGIRAAHARGERAVVEDRADQGAGTAPPGRGAGARASARAPLRKRRRRWRPRSTRPNSAATVGGERTAAGADGGRPVVAGRQIRATGTGRADRRTGSTARSAADRPVPAAEARTREFRRAWAMAEAEGVDRARPGLPRSSPT